MVFCTIFGLFFAYFGHILGAKTIFTGLNYDSLGLQIVLHSTLCVPQQRLDPVGRPNLAFKHPQRQKNTHFSRFLAYFWANFGPEIIFTGVNYDLLGVEIVLQYFICLSQAVRAGGWATSDL